MKVICYGNSNTYGYDPRGWLGGRFADAGGTQTFEGLVAAAGLKVPYAPGCIREIGPAHSNGVR